MLRDTEAEALPQATARERATQVAMARQKGASGGGGGEAAENLAKGLGPGGPRPRRSRSRRAGGHARRRTQLNEALRLASPTPLVSFAPITSMFGPNDSRADKLRVHPSVTTPGSWGRTRSTRLNKLFV